MTKKFVLIEVDELYEVEGYLINVYSIKNFENRTEVGLDIKTL